MEKGSILILIAVVIIALAGYFLYQQQIKSTTVTPLTQTTSDETANWKTYTASSQFEFKYPIAQYSVESGSANIDYAYPGQLIIKPNDLTVSAGSNIYTLTISLIINKKHLTLQNIDSLLGVDNSKNQFPPKTASLGGVDGVRYDEVPGQVNRTEIYVIKQDKNYTDGIIYNFTLRTLNGAKASSENEAIIQNILSTFKFLDKDTADTANWKTYTSTEAKVSFAYPSDWAVKEEDHGEYKRISIEGKEGDIALDYGSGFGGACLTESGYEDFKIGNAQTQACHEIYKDAEKWSLSNMKKDGVNFNNINYSGFVTANAPYKDNRDLILKILSTLKFTN